MGPHPRRRPSSEQLTQWAGEGMGGLLQATPSCRLLLLQATPEPLPVRLKQALQALYLSIPQATPEPLPHAYRAAPAPLPPGPLPPAVRRLARGASAP